MWVCGNLSGRPRPGHESFFAGPPLYYQSARRPRIYHIYIFQSAALGYEPRGHRRPAGMCFIFEPSVRAAYMTRLRPDQRIGLWQFRQLHGALDARGRLPASSDPGGAGPCGRAPCVVVMKSYDASIIARNPLSVNLIQLREWPGTLCWAADWQRGLPSNRYRESSWCCGGIRADRGTFRMGRPAVGRADGFSSVCNGLWVHQICNSFPPP
jgi:hypothetical protein